MGFRPHIDTTSDAIIVNLNEDSGSDKRESDSNMPCDSDSYISDCDHNLV